MDCLQNITYITASRPLKGRNEDGWAVFKYKNLSYLPDWLWLTEW